MTVNGGTVDGYWALITISRAKIFRDANAAYDLPKTMMGRGEYADYKTAEIYYRNGDWPNNNVRGRGARRCGASLKFYRLVISITASISSGSFGFSSSMNMFVDQT